MKFLKYFILFLFLSGCKGNSDQKSEITPPLYPEPLTVALNIKEGYTINQLTGDSIRPLITISGYTFKTGVPVPLISSVTSNEILQPKIVKGFHTIKTIISENVYTVPDKLPVTRVDTTRLKKIKLGEGDSSNVLKNSMGIVRTGVPIPVTGKKMPFSEPRPVKAAPMRFKDNATTTVQYLDVDQGLSYSYVYAICEDKKGNLWFGLDGTGISKYDGVNITNYSVKQGLSHNIVTSIIEDRNNTLWISSHGGVSCFDGKNFTQYTEKEGLSNNEILSLYEDRKGNIWFSTKGGLTKYDRNTFTHYSRKEGLPSDTVYNCIEDRNGALWIATISGVARFDGKSFTIYTDKDGLPDDVVSSLLEDSKGNIWLGTPKKGIFKFDGSTFVRYAVNEGLSDNHIWLMIKDRKDNIWIGTSGGGLNKFDGKRFIHYKLEQGLSNTKIRGIAEDQCGNIWFGTEGGGVNKLNPTSFDYKLPEEIIENSRVRPILKDKKGNLWFGTEGAHFGKLEAEQKPGAGKLFTYYKVHEKLYEKGQRSFLQDKNGNIWIGTTGSGLLKYDGKNFTNYLFGAGGKKRSIFDILEDKKGNIWFGVRDGSIISYDGENFASYTTKEGLPGSIIYSMLEDRNGNIWFCTESAGVYKYDGTNLTNYTEKEGLFSKSVLSIAEDDKGNIWLGTLGAGACKFDGSTFTYYSEKQGLSNNNIWSVFCDSANQLWFGTDKGLTLGIPKKNNRELKTGYNFYNFGSLDGLKAIDFNLHSVCVDDNNHIWWGTGKSVPSFDLNKKFLADTPRSLSLRYIEINEKFYDYRNVSDSTKKISFSSVVPFNNYPTQLKLSYDQNHLSFHFSAIDWSALHKIKYSYRMNGLDEKWSTPSNETKAEYRSLRYGKYEFQVKAIGQSQEWTEPFTYSFTIRPAWWQSWWFRALLTLIALAIAFFIGRFIYFYQLRKQRTALEKQLAVQYERQRISAEMHDDIGAGLSGIRLLTEMTKNKVKDEQVAEEVDKIYQSVGDISSKMKEVIWSLNTENDNLSHLIPYIQKQARQWFENYPCQLTVELPETTPPVDINGETRRNILLLVKEAAHNIIKHSAANKVNIKMDCNDGQFVIAVSDNGKGITSENNDASGNGMKNMRLRVQQLNGKFFIKNQGGLTLTFEIPLQQIA